MLDDAHKTCFSQKHARRVIDAKTASPSRICHNRSVPKEHIMTKAELVAKIAAKADLNKASAERALNAVI